MDKILDKLYVILREKIRGTSWTKDLLQDKLYRMETNKPSLNLKNRNECHKFAKICYHTLKRVA